MALLVPVVQAERDTSRKVRQVNRFLKTCFPLGRDPARCLLPLGFDGAPTQDKRVFGGSSLGGWGFVALSAQQWPSKLVRQTTDGGGGGGGWGPGRIETSPTWTIAPPCRIWGQVKVPTEVAVGCSRSRSRSEVRAVSAWRRRAATPPSARRWLPQASAWGRGERGTLGSRPTGLPSQGFDEALTHWSEPDQTVPFESRNL